jgi:hypothetical protein
MTEKIEVKSRNGKSFDRMNTTPLNEGTTDSPCKSPSKWRKLSLIVSAVQSFNHYGTKNIGNETDIDEDLRDYRTRLMVNTVNNRPVEIKDKSNSSFENTNQFDYEDNLRSEILKEILE